MGNRAVGSRIGRNLGVKFAQVTGWGDYEVTSNTLVKPSIVPDFGSSSIRVTHKEYLGNILGSDEFATQIYRLNPGISDSFPWLAGIARNYQQYRFNGAMFQFVSTSAFALNSTNSALGKVVIATNYNAEDKPFTSTVAMLSTQFSNYGRPAESIEHAIECAPGETPTDLFYIRNDIEAKGKDLRFTDLGFTQVSTEGMQSTSEVGGLWVTYDVSFTKPIINDEVNLDVGIDQFNMLCDTGTLYSGTITARNNILSGTAEFAASSLRYRFNQGVSSGTYLVIEDYTAADNKASIIYAGAWTFLGSDCSLVVDTDLNGPTNSAYWNPATNGAYAGVPNTDVKAVSSSAVRYYMVAVTGPRPYFQTGGFLGSGTGNIWRLSVIPISYDNTPQQTGPALP